MHQINTVVCFSLLVFTEEVYRLAGRYFSILSMQQITQKLAFRLPKICIQQVPNSGWKSRHSLQRCFSSLPEEVKIPVPWGHVSGKWWNRNQSDPILAIHGWLGNASTFDSLIPLLSQKLSILVVDLPGFGLSSHLPPGCYYHRFDSVVLVKRLVTHFKWENFSLVGHAMGGSIAFLYTSLFPETIKSLSIIDAPMTPIPMDEVKYIEGGGALIDQFIERDHRQSSSNERPLFSRDEIIEVTSNIFENQVSKETIERLLERNITCDSDDKCQFSHDRRLKDSRLSGFTHQEILKMAENLQTHVLMIKYDQSPYYMPKEDFYKSWVVVEKNATSAKMHVLKGTRHELLEDPKSASLILNEHLMNYHLVSTEK